MTSIQRLAFVLGLFLGIGLAVESRGADPSPGATDNSQQSAAGVRSRVSVKSAAEDVRIERSLTRDAFHSAWAMPMPKSHPNFGVKTELTPTGETKHIQYGEGAPIEPPLITAPRGKQYLFVLVSTEFPEGFSWNLAVFRLEDTAGQQYPLDAFDLAVDRPNNSDYAYLASKGALGKMEKDKNRAIIDTLSSSAFPPFPNHIIFPFGNSKWTGGATKLWLMFEIPTSASTMVLHRDADESGKSVYREWNNYFTCMDKVKFQEGSTFFDVSMRTWTDASGERKARAEVIGVTETAAKLRKEDGTTYEVSIDKLSEGDQRYLRKYEEAMGKSIWNLGPLEPAPDSATIPESLREEAGKTFRLGKRLFLWDAEAEESGPMKFPFENGVLQRKIGYAYSPDFDVTFFQLYGHFHRQILWSESNLKQICTGPIHPGRAGYVFVQLYALQPPEISSEELRRQWGVTTGTITINAIPLGSSGGNELEVLSNNVEIEWGVVMPKEPAGQNR